MAAQQTHSFDGLLPNNTWGACNNVLYVQSALRLFMPLEELKPSFVETDACGPARSYPVATKTVAGAPPCTATTYPPKGGLVVSTISSRDDLIAALVCAGFQPTQNPTCTCPYHGYNVIDAQCAYMRHQSFVESGTP